MSKRNKRQKKSFPWVFVVFGGILIIAAIFLFTNQNSGGSGAPAIAVDTQKIDYGYVPFGNNKTFTIKVTNNGDGVLRFKEKPSVEVLEGC